MAFIQSEGELANSPTRESMLTRNHDVESIWHLAPMQQGMLFHSTASQDAFAYCDQSVFLLHGPLNVKAFRRAWEKVLARHQALRSLFLWEGLSKPLQVVRRDAKLRLVELNWCDMQSDERKRALQDYLHQDRCQRFDFERAPLFRLALIHAEEECYYLIYTAHHLILDGWSIALAFREVWNYYCAYSAGDELELPPPRPYVDFVRWLQQQDMAAAELFWRETLRNLAAPTPLPLSRGQDGNLPAANVSHKTRVLRLETATTIRLQELARKQQLTLNTILQGAWAVLLSRYSGSPDVVFGATVSGRTADLVGIEQIVGLFINTLPVRAIARSQERLLPWLADLQLQQAKAQQYGYASLAEIQQWGEMRGGEPLFQTLLVFQNYPIEMSSGEAKGVRVELYQNIDNSPYPITLVASHRGALEIRVLHEESIASEAVERMLTHLQVLLGKIADSPNRKLGELEYLSQAEKVRVIEEWNRTETEYPHDQCVHQLFQAQVQSIPNAIAVSVEGQFLSYQELNARSNQLAHYLRKLGVRPEVRIGICMDRSLEMIVAILGILKAGAVYVPLDPKLPQERLRYVVEDVESPLVLTTKSLRKQLPPELKVLLLDEEMPLIGREMREDLEEGGLGSDMLAYVMYTSGSTGQPKGVAVSHRSIVRLVRGSQYVHWQAGDVCLQAAPLAFDASTFEIWGCLLNGGRLVMSSPGAVGINELGRILRESGTTVLWLTSGLFDQLVEQEVESLTGVREIVAGGDVLSVPHVTRAVQAGCCVTNGYGPTENTTFTACYRVPAANEMTRPTIPIGKPIANTQVYVLDEELMPVGIGIEGEAYVGGAGLARGYWNQPDLTAEKFVPNPFSGDGGERLYRTGDRVRWLEDGNLEFAGRVDHQVKIRGYRIELGEIEAVLQQHPGVIQAVVVVREHETRDKRLIGYLRLNQGVSKGDLRSYLLERLPEYMVPNALIEAGELPQTPNGKVDRRALALFEEEEKATEDHARPMTAAEEILIGIWKLLLKQENIGIHDDFFERGGHSLLATRLITRLRMVFGVELPLRALFETPTIAGLARQIEIRQGIREQVKDLPLVAVKARDAYPLSFAQQRLWFWDQLQPAQSAYNVPVCLRLRGELNVEALDRSLSEIVRRHEILRTRFVMREGEPMQVVDPQADLEMRRLDLSSMMEHDRELELQRVMASEAQAGFDLGDGRLIRVSLARLKEQDHVLLVTMHHIVSDAWSFAVMVREFRQFYEGFAKGEETRLEDLAIQYRDFAIWQRTWLQGEILERQLAYWRKQLDGCEELKLPTDYTRGTNMRGGASLTVVWSRALVKELERLSRDIGVTMFMVVLAGFQALLHRYTGQQDLAVGTIIANRNRAEMEGLIGCFVNQLVLRTEVIGDMTFLQLLERVREITLAAYAHQDLPFEKLVEEMQPERLLDHAPLSNALLVLQNAPEENLMIAGLEIEPLELVNTGAQTDLMLVFRNMGDGMMIAAEYDDTLFDRSTIQRMLQFLHNLIKEVCADQTQVISAIKLDPQMPARGHWQELAGANNRSVTATAGLK
jgi:amino acid adenylation domain-containing protein